MVPRSRMMGTPLNARARLSQVVVRQCDSCLWASACDLWHEIGNVIGSTVLEPPEW